MRGRIKIDQILKLEDTLTDFYSLLREIADLIEKLEPNVRTDSSREMRDVIEVKAEIDRRMAELPSVTALLILEPIVNAVRWAKELEVADNGCTLGRDGCEKRWDRTIAGMRKALRRIDFDSDTLAPLVTCDGECGAGSHHMPSGRRRCDACGGYVGKLPEKAG